MGAITDLTRLILLNPTNKDLCKHLEERTETLRDSIITGGSREAKIRLIDDLKTLSKEIRSRLLYENGDNK